MIMKTAVALSSAPILTWSAQPGTGTFVIYHVVALDDWLAFPDRPYAPASLSEEGFVHCSPDEAVTLAVASAFYRDVWAAHGTAHRRAQARRPGPLGSRRPCGASW